MTVHVISVGLSVLDALADPEDKFAGKPDLVGAIRRHVPGELLESAGVGDRDRRGASDWLAAALRTAGSAPRSVLLEAASAVRPGEWPLRVSAEVETFGRVQSTGGFSLSAGDIALLVCSDTPPGLLAGVWNALALTGGDLNAVRYVPGLGPGDSLGDLRGRAVLVRVARLDARDVSGFRDAMSGLCLLARQLFASGSLQKTQAGPEEFRFYLSGGFKAAVPYLVGLAEAVRSVDRDCLAKLGAGDLAPASGMYPVRAFMLHEAAIPGTPPLELPLRRLVARVVRSELAGFDNGRRTGKPATTILEGYAYEVTGGGPGTETCELTPFGAGLHALFGLPREGFGQ
jgi:hypothetical protein